MTIKTNGENKCSFCGGTEWKKLINPKAQEKKDTNIHRCKKCGSVVDFGAYKEDVLHTLYHEHPDKEPQIRSISEEKKHD